MAIALTVDSSVYNYPENEDQNWGTQATQWAQAVTNVITLLNSPTVPLADSGQIRLGNADSIEFRNITDVGNLKLYTNGQNKLFFNDGTTDFDLTSTAAGDVNGPGTSTDNAIPRWDLASGTLIQDSAVLIDDTNNMSGIAALSATSVTSTDLTSTGTLSLSGAGPHTVSNGVADDIRNAQTRTTTTATATGGNIALSNGNSGTFSTASTSFVDVTNLTATITTTQTRVLRVATIAIGSGSSYIAQTTGAFNSIEAQIVRDGSVVVGKLFISGPTTAAHPCYLETMEVLVAGTYTYKIQARTANGSASANVVNVSLMVQEV